MPSQAGGGARRSIRNNRDTYGHLPHQSCRGYRRANTKERNVATFKVESSFSGFSRLSQTKKVVTVLTRHHSRLLAQRPLRAAQAVPAVEALVAGAVADGQVAADVAERGVAHHGGELGAHAAVVLRGKLGAVRRLAPDWMRPAHRPPRCRARGGRHDRCRCRSHWRVRCHSRSCTPPPRGRPG